MFNKQEETNNKVESNGIRRAETRNSTQMNHSSTSSTCGARFFFTGPEGFAGVAVVVAVAESFAAGCDASAAFFDFFFFFYSSVSSVIRLNDSSS